MADTRAQREVEEWVTKKWLPRLYDQPFEARAVLLRPGGRFKFDAVSADGRIIANISTSRALTASGKRGAGKLQKIRADMLFLLLADVGSRLLVFTEPDMYALLNKEKENGRVPVEIEIRLAEIPDSLRESLEIARMTASDEVLPAPRRIHEIA